MVLRTLVKYILFLVNLLFTLIGLALVAVGVVVILKYGDAIDEIATYIPVNLKAIPYVAIGVGAVIFFIAFSGCCGAITESKCMLIIYAICIAVLAAFKIYIAVQLFTNMEYVTETVENEMNKVFSDPQLNTTFHAFEATFECCGTYGPDSYNITYNGVQYVAPTCCKNPTEETICTKDQAFEQGCTTLVVEWLQTLGDSSRLTLIIIIVVEILVVILALYLANTVKQK